MGIFTDHLILGHRPRQGSEVRLVLTAAMAVRHEHAEWLRVRSNVRLNIRETARLTSNINVKMLRP